MNGIAFYLTALREASHYQKCGIFGVAVNGPCCVLYPKSAMEIYFRFRTTPPPSFCINSKTCTFGNEGLPSTVRSPFFTEYFACYHICVLFHHQVLSQFCLNHQCTAMHINADQGLWRPVSTMHCLDPECIVLLINTAAAAEARSRWSESQLKCTPALFQGFPSTALRWRCIQKTFDKKHNKHHHN